MNSAAAPDLRRILVVDDEHEVAATMADALSDDLWHCQIATSGEGALEAARAHAFDVVLSDVGMPGMDGIELMARLRHVHADLPVVLITARGSIPSAVAAVRGGAAHYLTKPCNTNELRRTVRGAAQSRPSLRVCRWPSESRCQPGGIGELLGESAAMRALHDRVALAAQASSPVLVMGETGTGKELVARAIHVAGPRSARPFVTVNTAAIPAALLESEMFGHVRGAFTGASQSHRGVLDEADGGTLFLDEIGDMPLTLQAKLLRVLQSGEVRPVGSERVRHVDVRIVAATHRDLPELVRQGQFRSDLFYRLDVIRVTVPPLRARSTDIAQLARTFLERARKRAPQSRVASLSDETIAMLSSLEWPGNVRELENAIERLAILVQEETVEPRHLALIGDDLMPSRIERRAPVLGRLDDVVRRHVDMVLASTDGNKAQAAKILGIDLSTLYRWQQKKTMR